MITYTLVEYPSDDKFWWSEWRWCYYSALRIVVSFQHPSNGCQHSFQLLCVLWNIAKTVELASQSELGLNRFPLNCFWCESAELVQATSKLVCRTHVHTPHCKTEAHRHFAVSLCSHYRSSSPFLLPHNISGCSKEEIVCVTWNDSLQ